MSVYMIFRLEVTDLEKFTSYGMAVQPLLRKHQAKNLVVDFNVKALEGTGQTFSVILEFASEALATSFYDDPDYVPLRTLRGEATANTSVILCDAFVPRA